MTTPCPFCQVLVQLSPRGRLHRHGRCPVGGRILAELLGHQKRQKRRRSAARRLPRFLRKPPGLDTKSL